MFMTSQSEKSTCSPWPQRRARVTAPRAATAAKVPPIQSVIRPPHMIGGCEGRPRTERAPLCAWIVRSEAGWFESGPPRP